MITSGSITANGSSPMMSRAHQTAWPRPLGCHLAGEAHLPGGGQFGDHLLEDLQLALGQQLGLQLDLVIEIVLDRLLGATGDEDDVLDPGLARLFDDVAQDRPIDDVQQFLGRGLGAGQDAGAQARDGQDGLAEAGGR